jgi:hypothetical protein
MTFGLLKGFLDGAGFFFMELFRPYGAFSGPKFKPQTMNSV